MIILITRTHINVRENHCFHIPSSKNNFQWIKPKQLFQPSQEISLYSKIMGIYAFNVIKINGWLKIFL